MPECLDGRLIELVSDLICVCRSGRIMRVNWPGARLLGFEHPEQMAGRAFCDLVDPNSRHLLKDGLEALAEASKSVALALLRSDGSAVQVELQAHIVPDADGTPSVALLARERSRPPDTLLRSEERYRRLVDLGMDFTCVCVGAEVAFVNAAGLALVGAKASGDVVGRPFSLLVHPDYRPIVEDGLDVLAAEGGPIPLKFMRLDGTALDVEVKAMPLGDEAEGIMLEARDVTEHKRSAEALREREQRLQGIMDVVAEGIIVADEFGVIQSLNPAAQRIFGYSADEAVGRNVHILMNDPDAAAHGRHMGDYLHSGDAKVLGVGRESQGRHRDGFDFPIELNVAELKRGRQRLFIGVIRDITERKRAEEALRRARDELEIRVDERTRELSRLSHETRQILNSAGEGIIGLDSSLRITFANPAAAAMMGCRTEALAGETLEDFVAEVLPGERSSGKPFPLKAALTRGLLRENAQMTLVRRGGTRFPVEFACAPIEEDGNTSGYVVVFRDITERLRNEDKLRLAATVFERASEAIVITDADHRVTAANPAFTEITGWSAAEILGRPPTFLTSGLYDEEESKRIWAVVKAEGRWEGELWNLRRDGSKYAERLAISAIHGEDGAITQYVILLSDITRRKLDEERIRYQANYDALTGLPNRALFLDRLQQAVASAERSRERVGLMFIDLDGFKLVNDTLGHDIGDALLCEAGRRLQGCVRSADTVARLGGDEFTIIMPDLRDIRNAPIVAQRIIDSLQKPFDLSGQEAFVSASIGITSFPDDAGDTATLLKNADAAMYRAKEQGKANYQFFTHELNAEASERLVIKNGLSKALDRQEFVLYYQPKVCLATGTISGVEALMRWRNPDLGMVSPAKFIPVMEETGLIGPIGEWAIEVACRQHKAWREEGFNLRVAVNLSVRQLRQPNLAQVVRDILDRTGIAPCGLELEITESMIMKDTENAVAVLRQLHDMGVHLAMDDFGTGYSSLSYLKRFPLHTIKIDRSFVRDIVTDTDDHEIIKTIIGMGHSLRRRIVAEGVETEEQMDILKRLRCDEIQGYLVSPPVPAAEIGQILLDGVQPKRGVPAR